MAELREGDIVKGLAPDQQVRLISVKQLGANWALEGIGMTTDAKFTRVVTARDAELSRSLDKTVRSVSTVIPRGSSSGLRLAGFRRPSSSIRCLP